MKSGIYKIINIVNNKFYIGSSYNIFNRWSLHKNQLMENKHHNIHLQRSWNINGENNFLFEIIELCEVQKCIDREQYYIDTLKPHYNINPKAISCLGVKRSIEFKNKISLVAKNRKFSKETRQKMSKSQMGRLATTKDKSFRLIKDDLGVIYTSILAASLFFNVKYIK